MPPEPSMAQKVPPLSDEQVRDALAMATVGISADQRKIEAWRRWLVFSEQFEPLVAAKIAGTHEDLDTIKRISKFVDVSVNLALDVMDQVCVVWDKPATRHVGLEPSELPEEAEPEPAQMNAPPFGAPPTAAPAAPDEAEGPPALGGMPAPQVKPPKPKPAPKPNPQTEALRKLYREHLQLDSWLQDLNKLAWWLVKVVVVPKIRKGKLRADVLLPFFYDEIPDPEDMQGPPLGYVYTLKREDKNRTLMEIMDGSLRTGDVVVLDSESWRIYDYGTRDPSKPREVIPHNLGYVPAIPLCFSRSLDGTSYGDYRRHRRLYDATITCATIATKLSYVRKAQDRRLPVAIGNFEGDDEQTADPEGGVKFRSESPQVMSFEVHDFDTPPDNHIKHLSFHYDKAASAYGGSSSESVGEGGSLSPKITFSHEAQTEIRVDQIPYARDFERDLAAICCDMVKRASAGFSDPELAEALPEPDEVREELSVQFAPLSRKFASFADERAFLDFQKNNGLASQYDFARRQDPDLSDEQARNMVLRKLEEAAEVNDIAAKRNLPMDGEGVKDLSQIQGKAGPMARDNPSNDGPPDGDPKDEK